SDPVVPIGRPLANQRIYVLNSRLQAQPVGVVGELCIAGAGVARGYLNLPDRTAASFVADPFADQFDEAGKGAGDKHARRHLVGDGRMYRTGDLGYWSEDMKLMYVGRADTQVKIRGYRVELGEVEAAVMQVPETGISRAVVLPFEPAPGAGKVLVA